MPLTVNSAETREVRSPGSDDVAVGMPLTAVTLTAVCRWLSSRGMTEPRRCACPEGTVT